MKELMNRPRWILAILLGFSALGLLLAGAQHSFWEDEAYTAQIAGLGWPQVVTAVENIHPPLYFSAAAVWGRLFGYNELGLRSLSVVLAILAIGLLYRLARRLFDERTALLAAGFLASSPLFLVYAHNARYFALAMCLVLLGGLALVEFQLGAAPRRYIWLVGYTLAGSALLYTLYSAAPAFLVFGVFWLLLWQRSSRRMSDLALFILANTLIAISFLPWLATLRQAAGEQIDPAAGLPGPAAFGIRLGYWGLAFGAGETLSPLSPFAWLALLGAAWLSWRAWQQRRAQPHVWLPLLALLVVGLFGVALNAAARYPQSAPQALGHRLLFILPFFSLWLAIGAAQPGGRWGWVLGLVVMAAWLVGMKNYFTGQQYLTPQLAVPWRAIMQEIQATAAPGDRIICGQADSTCAYYAKRYGLNLAGGPDAWAASPPENVWWVQSNLSSPVGDATMEQAALAELKRTYPFVDLHQYAPQSPSIRWIKQRLLGMQDFAYRVEVFHFRLSP